MTLLVTSGYGNTHFLSTIYGFIYYSSIRLTYGLIMLLVQLLTICFIMRRSTDTQVELQVWRFLEIIWYLSFKMFHYFNEIACYRKLLFYRLSEALNWFHFRLYMGYFSKLYNANWIKWTLHNWAPWLTSLNFTNKTNGFYHNSTYWYSFDPHNWPFQLGIECVLNIQHKLRETLIYPCPSHGWATLILLKMLTHRLADSHRRSGFVSKPLLTLPHGRLLEICHHFWIYMIANT